MSRYWRILNELQGIRAQSVIEVGTWNGLRAVEMARAAASYTQTFSYFGFDLFESMTALKSKAEFNVKRPFSLAEVREHLRSSFPAGFHFELMQGDTRITLPLFAEQQSPGAIDLAWIDGGHSIETIWSDWMACSRLVRAGGVILLDDYYSDLPEETLGLYGCNRLVERLRKDDVKVTLFPERDPVRGGGSVQIAKVQVG